MPYQIFQRDDHIELRLEGVIEADLTFEADELERFAAVRKVLIDYSAVTEIRADAYSLAEYARANEARGLKIAAFAPRPDLFGLNRQVLQLGSVREGVSAAVFSDIDAAREWLTPG